MVGPKKYALIGKKQIFTLIVNVFLLTFCSQNSYTQENPDFEFTFDVQKVYNGIHTTKDDVRRAKTLVEINEYYKPEWIKEFKQVTYSIIIDRKQKYFVADDDTLFEEIRMQLLSADPGSSIEVEVAYLPDNNLNFNDLKHQQFSFIFEPDISASYHGGNDALAEYLTSNAIEKLSKSVFKQHHLTAVNFIIDSRGQINDVEVFESSGDLETDRMLVDALCKMPAWSPAKYEDGMEVDQQYVLLVGDMNSCVINLVNISKEYNPLLQEK